MSKLQLALDLLSFKEALKIVRKTRKYVDRKMKNKILTFK